MNSATLQLSVDLTKPVAPQAKTINALLANLSKVKLKGAQTEDADTDEEEEETDVIDTSKLGKKSGKKTKAKEEAEEEEELEASEDDDGDTVEEDEDSDGEEETVSKKETKTTVQTLRKALNAYKEEHDTKAAINMLKKFGVKSVDALPKEKWGKFLKAVQV